MSGKKIKIRNVIDEPISGEWGNEGDTVFVIRTTNFTNNGTLDLSDIVSRNIPVSKIEKKRLLPGDTILEKSGGSPNQPVGRVVYFDLTKNWKDYLCNNFTSIIRPQKSIHPKYLFWFLFYNHVSKNTLRYQNKTTGILNLKTEKYLDDLEIPFPVFTAQQRIATILDKADALRKKDQVLLKKYDELLQSIFHKMFGDPVKNEKTWEKKKIKDIAAKEKNSIKAGPFGSSLKKEVYVKDGYKIYGQEQVIRDDLSFGDYYIDEKKYKELENCKVQTGDILISLVGTYGKISVVPDTFKPGIINPRLMKITPDKSLINSIFFKMVLLNESVRNQIENFSRGGTMDIVNLGIMKEISIPVPPIVLQNQFERIFQNVEKQKLQIKQQIQNSESLFRRLLQKAFKGELIP